MTDIPSDKPVDLKDDTSATLHKDAAVVPPGGLPPVVPPPVIPPVPETPVVPPVAIIPVVPPPGFPPVVPPITPPPLVPPLVPPGAEIHAAPSTPWRVDRAPGEPPAIVFPNMSAAKETQELDPKWVAGREGLLRKELGLPANAPDSAIQPAWGKMLETELEKKYGASNFNDAIKAEAQEAQKLHKYPHHVPEVMSAHDKQVFDLMAEHDKRVARDHFDLPKDASEAQIFQKMYPSQ